MNSAQTVLIFANPNAGRGLARTWADRIAQRSREDGFVVRLVLERPSDFVPDLDVDYRAAVVIGGDGTLRAVAERLYHSFDDPPPLLLVPMGTANLIGKHLALPWRRGDPTDQVARARRRQRRRIREHGARARWQPPDGLSVVLRCRHSAATPRIGRETHRALQPTANRELRI